MHFLTISPMWSAKWTPARVCYYQTKWLRLGDTVKCGTAASFCFQDLVPRFCTRKSSLRFTITIDVSPRGSISYTKRKLPKETPAPYTFFQVTKPCDCSTRIKELDVHQENCSRIKKIGTARCSLPIRAVERYGQNLLAMVTMECRDKCVIVSLSYITLSQPRVVTNPSGSPSIYTYDDSAILKYIHEQNVRIVPSRISTLLPMVVLTTPSSLVCKQRSRSLVRTSWFCYIGATRVSRAMKRHIADSSGLIG